VPVATMPKTPRRGCAQARRGDLRYFQTSLGVHALRCERGASGAGIDRAGVGEGLIRGLDHPEIRSMAVPHAAACVRDLTVPDSSLAHVSSVAPIDS
jgi:hypothetical protein